MVDVQFATAVQLVLTLALAARDGIPSMSSSELAVGLVANPSLVRRLVAPLVRAGVLVSSQGKSGGVGLARPPTEITLAEVYRAVFADRKLFCQRPNIPARCLVTSNIRQFFDRLHEDVDAAVGAALQARSLEQCLVEMERRDRKGGRQRRAKASS